MITGAADNFRHAVAGRWKSANMAHGQSFCARLQTGGGCCHFLAPLPALINLFVVLAGAPFVSNRRGIGWRHPAPINRPMKEYRRPKAPTGWKAALENPAFPRHQFSPPVSAREPEEAGNVQLQQQPDLQNRATHDAIRQAFVLGFTAERGITRSYYVRASPTVFRQRCLRFAARLLTAKFLHSV